MIYDRPRQWSTRVMEQRLHRHQLPSGILQQLGVKRADATICASHDLVLIFESAIGVRWDKDRQKATFRVPKAIQSISLKGTAAVEDFAKKPTTLAAPTLQR
jgi:hypothetical protein